MKRAIIISALVVLAILAMSCKQEMIDRRLLGTWEETNGYYTATFTETLLTIDFDNPMLGSLTYEWTAKDGVLTLNGASSGTKNYSISGDTLIMGSDVLHKVN